MGNVSIIKKFWKKFLNVNFDDFGLTISLNSERIMKMMKLAIAKRAAIGALTNQTLQVMSAISVKLTLRVMSEQVSKLGILFRYRKNLGGKVSIHEG